MATTTSITAATGAWTLAYTAGAAVTLNIQCRSPSLGLLVRVGASAATSDSLDAAAEYMNPLELRSFVLANTDKVLVRPANGGETATVILRV